MTIRERMEVIETDITTLSVNAIVNAANAALAPGGGVDGAIRRKAGREIDEDLRAIGRCEEGSAVITPGYGLLVDYVIHTVAPVWAGAAQRAIQEPLLARCYESVLKLADENNIRTIAFPSIGTGAYRWPADVAARIAFQTVANHLRHCETQTFVTFCCFARADRERYADMIAALRD